MTFDEAKKKKESLPETYGKDEREYEYAVMPELNSDIEKYLVKIHTLARAKVDITDEVSIKFSSNNKFIVSGFWTDGIDLILDDENF